MAFDRQAALAAGYSEAEIDEYLSSQQAAPVQPQPAPAPQATGGFDVEGARTAGYTDAEIQSHLSGRQTPVSAQEAPTPRYLKQNEVEFELNQMFRAGASSQDVMQFLDVVRNPDNDQPWAAATPKGRETLQRSVEAGVAYRRSGGNENIPFVVERVGADGLPSSDLGSYARGIGDALSFNSLDELQAALASGRVSGPEYEQAWAEQQQRRAADNPDFRGAGKAVGTGISMVVPGIGMGRAGALGARLSAARGAAVPAQQTARILGEAAAGGLAGAAYTGAGQYGANAPGEGFAGVPEAAMVGGVLGAGVPLAGAAIAPVSRALGIGAKEASAEAIERVAGPEELLAAAEEFRRRTGRAPSLIDIMPEGRQGEIARGLYSSPEAQRRVVQRAQDVQASLPEELAGRIATTPNVSPTAIVPTPQAGAGPIAGSRDIRGPVALRREVSDRGKREYGAFETVVVQPNAADKMLLEEALANSGMAGPRMADIRERLSRGGLTAGDLTKIRSRLGARERSRPNEGYADYRDSVDDILERFVPEAAEARRNFNLGMETVEGAIRGRQISRTTAGSVDVPERLAGMTDQQRRGAAVGARSGLFQRATESPRAALQLANDLEQSPAFRNNLRQALGDEEADTLIAHAETTKRAIDNVLAMAGKNPQNAGSIMDDSRELVDALVAAGRGAGTSMVSRIIMDAARGVGAGVKAANTLAADILDPSKRDEVIKLLEARKNGKMRLRQELQSAVITVGSAAGTEPDLPDPMYQIGNEQ